LCLVSGYTYVYMWVANFRATVAQRLGLRFDDSKLDELADVLRLRMGATNSPDVDSYLCLLGTSLPELRAVVGHHAVAFSDGCRFGLTIALAGECRAAINLKPVRGWRGSSCAAQ
jgi:hypothetical protein